MSISQTEFKYLLTIPKEFETLQTINLGPAPMNWSRKINSTVSKDAFMLDFYRGSFELTKYTYNKRFKQTIVLLRYDAKGRHTNPDGATFDGPHVQLYKEGYNDKFAYPVSEIDVSPSDSLDEVLSKILSRFNVTNIPSINIPLF